MNDKWTASKFSIVAWWVKISCFNVLFAILNNSVYWLGLIYLVWNTCSCPLPIFPLGSLCFYYWFVGVLSVVGFYNFHMYVSDTAYSQKSLLVYSLWGCVCVCTCSNLKFLCSQIYQSFPSWLLNFSHLERVSTYQILKYTLYSSNTKSPFIWVSFLCLVPLICSSIPVRIIWFQLL